MNGELIFLFLFFVHISVFLVMIYGIFRSAFAEAKTQAVIGILPFIYFLDRYEKKVLFTSAVLHMSPVDRVRNSG